ncbi:MAG TPA: ribonuclease P protein component [Methylomirabilota bacterium]|nr:ribonuclease P protein component [Methylomirabilota bacterium]
MAPERQARQKFPRSMRLQRRRDFTYLKEKGERLAYGCLVLNWLGNPNEKRPRLGVVTSANIGPAVVRSRARRLLREAFRKNQDRFPSPTDVVLVARRSIYGKSGQEVERDLLRAMDRAGIQKKEQ